MRMSDLEKNPESSPAKMEEKGDAMSQKEEPMDTTESGSAGNIDAGGDGPTTSDTTKDDKVSDDAPEDNESEKASSGDEEEVQKKSVDKKEEKEENNKEGEDDDEEEEEEEEKETPKKETPKKETPKKETPKRTPKKAKVVEKSEEEEDEEDEEPKLGLLEQPVIIQSGKRTKRKVERLEIAVSTPKETNVDIPEGSGTRLGDIAAIEHHLNRNLADDLKPIHRILFGKVGQASTVKKNIRKFNGFSFDADSTEYKKKQQILSKMTNQMLKPICETLTLERGGSKEALVTRIMEFLLKPQDTGKSVPQKRKRKSKADGDKKGKRKSKGDKEKKAKKETKKKAKKEDGSGEEEDAEEEESVEEEEEDADESEKEDSASESEEEEKPKKKKAKIEPKKPAPKKAAPKKKKEESESEEDKNEESESEEEEKPKDKGKKAAPKKKKAPSDDDIKDTVKKILEGANLEEVTMKTVCKQVYAKFPGFDLSHKKEFIKASVKQIIR